MKRRFLQILVLVFMFAFVGIIIVEAAQYSGMVLVKRDSSRKIVGCALDTGRTDAAGNSVRYMLVMDENGNAIAQQHENKDVKIEGSLSGNNLKAFEWQEVREGYFDSSYVAPEPEKEPSESGDEAYNEDEEEEYDEDGNVIEKPAKKPVAKPVKKENNDEDEDEYNDEGDNEEEPADDSGNDSEEAYDEDY
ncbi:hypothetical protein EOM81_01010 [bacterium]|nr:hypothetical protein [bacterium]